MKIKGKLKNLKKTTKDFNKIKKKLNSNFRKAFMDINCMSFKALRL